MKIKYTYSFFLLLITFSFYAQTKKINEKRDQLKVYKIAFLKEELNLTSIQAQNFWPLYNAYQDKEFELRQEKMKTRVKELNNESFTKMSEKKAIELLSQMNNNEAKLYLLRKNFITNLKKILPAKKIIQLWKLENDFNQKLLRLYRNKKIDK